MRTSVLGINKIPDCAAQIGDPCWQTAVSNGTVRVIESGIELTGYSTRPVSLAVYMNVANNSCLKMVYADDGSVVGDFPSTSGGCFTSPIGRAVGTEDGACAFFPDFVGGKFFRYTWDRNRRALNGQQDACTF